MKIRLNLDSIALLLFCSDILSEGSDPLTSEEWYEIERRLKMSSLKDPSRLFGMGKDALTQIMQIEEYIVDKMMLRTSCYDKLMYALYNLQNEGINITTKYEDNYPKELTQSLKRKAPLFLYYVGDLSLLNNMVSIVEPIKSDKANKYFTKNLIKKLVNEDKVLVSHSYSNNNYILKQYIKEKGKAICFVSDHMLDKKQSYNRLIREGNMLLLSAVDPYAYYTEKNRNDRDTYICGLSEYQFVSAVEINNGSHWYTSIQNMHYHWTVQLVNEDYRYNGNMRLLEMGAIKISNEDILSTLTIEQIVEKNRNEDLEDDNENDQISIFDLLGE
jgi:predicted Rossmann fold nucleotide-binding protein DprA/Smf involved in DNA uptake